MKETYVTEYTNTSLNDSNHSLERVVGRYKIILKSVRPYLLDYEIIPVLEEMKHRSLIFGNVYHTRW